MARQRKEYTMVSIRLTPDELTTLDRLQQRWDCTRTEAIRRAAREALRTLAHIEAMGEHDK